MAMLRALFDPSPRSTMRHHFSFKVFWRSFSLPGFEFLNNGAKGLVRRPLIGRQSFTMIAPPPTSFNTRTRALYRAFSYLYSSFSYFFFHCAHAQSEDYISLHLPTVLISFATLQSIPYYLIQYQSHKYHQSVCNNTLQASFPFLCTLPLCYKISSRVQAKRNRISTLFLALKQRD
ncbi:hypothetical protein BU24DRAFT_218708 [Aaosphaeria arxii CBS 175.79]|uniref:Uncharacterized protein n=1 Tax=Aaosphaeria arxii CBS 175.79 TaxID=1450172 RepID=A0A6A5XP19_9PLEO|nr:uncharacterized protein BU24DRAFT_218708 [Aaosphaeria arxii CBS 175.79]KAF2014649.1 hypothetical protein BU24DRAFT_218708 [Aaosphaeria arxii CBS 175.79]